MSFDGFESGKSKAGFSGLADSKNSKARKNLDVSPTTDEFGIYDLQSRGMSRSPTKDAK